MRHTNGRFALAVPLLIAWLATPGHAQELRRGDAFRMDIQNGSMMTVRYFGTSLSPGERSVLREMEEIENRLSYSRGLTALKREYVLSERLLEPVRRDMQRSLYTRNISAASYSPDFGWGGWTGWGLANGFPYGTWAAGVPGFNTYLYNPWVFGGNAGVAAGGLGGQAAANRSLAATIADEGPMKEALAKVVAQQATPEYVASLERAYDRVAMRASASPSLRTALRLPREDAMRRDRILTASDEESSPVTLTLKGGDKVSGESMRETKDWFILTRAGGGEVRVRASEVVRVVATKKGAIKPAAD